MTFRPDPLPEVLPGATPDLAAEPSATPRGARVLASEDLFGDDTERRLIIRHAGREYVLFVTKQGKLLLNRHG